LAGRANKPLIIVAIAELMFQPDVVPVSLVSCASGERGTKRRGHRTAFRLPMFIQDPSTGFERL